MEKELGIYIHIPFCVKKCNYCDFNSGSFSDEIKARYVDALCKEIEVKSEFFKDHIINTVFIGGGTPSILPYEYIGRILETLRSFYYVSDSAEVSIECNPGTVDENKLINYKNFWINRISFGLQSADNDELKVLGRIHSYEEFLESFKLARKAGFENINVDLMCAIPDQSVESFKNSLNNVLNLNPEHISIYSLIIEEGTPFYDMKLNLVNEDDEREMVHIIPEILGDEYCQYEISNYAKKGYECKHNIKYWKRDAYLGFGVSAASLLQMNGINALRLKNTDSVNEYIKIINSDIESVIIPRDFNTEYKFYIENALLTEEDIISEYMILGLRMNRGISKTDFYDLFGKDVYEMFGDVLNRHKKDGLLKDEQGHIVLTMKGRDLANHVWKDFI
ncbi:MAG: radical SAM family heme chaperone HemW [Lachnospiraceae bacterium]|nr:radical SAM family heme chaperone HemW [Lachnospiraceae bacterium]